MKKTWLVGLALAVVLSFGQAQAQVVINEVYSDAPGGTETTKEWFELYNAGSEDVDLSGWRICDNTDSVGEVLPSYVLASGEYIVYCGNLDSFHVYFPAVPALAWTDGSIGGGLANAADILVLVNNSGVMVDRVNWGTGTWTQASYVKYGYWNPGTTAPPQGSSTGRSPNGYDTDQVTDWSVMASPTPGASNGGAVVYTPHTIYDIQHGGSLTDSAVTVVGVVTSAKWVDFSGFAIAEGPGAWHGITVYSTTAVSRGDSVTINGTVAENNGRTQISAAQVTKLGTGTIPAATQLQLSDLKTGAATAESYEGVLVRIPKALATDTTWMSPTFGEWAVCSGADTLMIDNSSNPNGIYYAKPAFGVDSVTVTGILNYTFDNFKLMPRDSADVINHGPTGVPGGKVASPAFHLMPCSPNPASRETKFSFSLAREGRVELAVFNVLGQKVATVHQGVLAAGKHNLAWSLKGQDGQSLPNGVYFYSLSDGSRTSTRRMLIIK